MRRARLFGSHLSSAQRRVYGAVVVFYVLAAFGMSWPVYAIFSRVRPLVLGMPFSLFYLACWVIASFLVLLALFRWESRQGEAEGDSLEGAAQPGSESGDGA